MDIYAESYKRFLDGDQESLGELVEALANPLILFITAYVKDYHLAEDIMEDCFVDLIVKKPKFRGDSKFKTYLFQIAKNKALNHIKRHKKFIWITEEDAEHVLREDENILSGMIQDEEKLKLYKALQKIPKQYQDALHLIYIEELTYEECAQVMGKNKKQIDNYLYQGKKRLEEILREEDIANENN